MNKKIFVSLLVLLLCFTVAGCTKKENEDNNNVSSNNNSSDNSNTKKKLSCSNESSLFHSKKRVVNNIYLDKNNKLVDYEYVEEYYAFDNDSEFRLICDGSEVEEENNNKLYNYMIQNADCNRDTKIVNISNKYDISKLPSKNVFDEKDVKNNLTDDYIFDLDNYKTTVIGKGYTCE